MFIIGLGLNACTKDRLLEDGEEYSGGQATVFNTSRNAFSFPIPALDNTEELEFATGNSFFNQSWVSSPASTTARDGLGPLFNEPACSSCHFKDGRGRSPQSETEIGHGFLMRLSIGGQNIYGGTVDEPTYGGQLNPIGVPGVEGEGNVKITYQEITGTFADGTAYSLRKPRYEITNLGYGAMASDVMFSPRVANHMCGLGLLEAITEADILANVDEQDADADGVSGRANYVYDVESGIQAIGRFGWKANQPNLRQQSAGAFRGDMGITSSLFPEQPCTSPQADCNDAPNGNNANGYELDDYALDRVELYVSTLAVPARRNWEDKEVLKGKELFLQANCQSCHVQKFTTGTHPKISGLSNQTIYPYTDLLLHDMGEDLADNRPDFLATGSEWRTPPLWGIGLIETVNGHTEFLHDGRARNLTEAILWHGGEAENSKQQFLEFSEEERERLILFLESL